MKFCFRLLTHLCDENELYSEGKEQEGMWNFMSIILAFHWCFLFILVWGIEDRDYRYLSSLNEKTRMPSAWNNPRHFKHTCLLFTQWKTQSVSAQTPMNESKCYFICSGRSFPDSLTTDIYKLLHFLWLNLGICCSIYNLLFCSFVCTSLSPLSFLVQVEVVSRGKRSRLINQRNGHTKPETGIIGPLLCTITVFASV